MAENIGVDEIISNIVNFQVILWW